MASQTESQYAVKAEQVTFLVFEIVTKARVDFEPYDGECKDLSRRKRL
jgi:hypothetical protein